MDSDANLHRAQKEIEFKIKDIQANSRFPSCQNITINCYRRMQMSQFIHTSLGYEFRNEKHGFIQILLQ